MVQVSNAPMPCQTLLLRLNSNRVRKILTDITREHGLLDLPFPTDHFFITEKPVLSFLSGSKVNKRVRLRTGLFRISDQMWFIIRRMINNLPETFCDTITFFGFLWNSNCMLSTMSSHGMRFAYILWKRYSIVISDPRRSVRNVKNSKF
jgi:hypothetical protein